MPMFYIPKPRQFRYQPRFYDPEKERWEALKMKYALEHEQKEVVSGFQDVRDGSDSTEDKDLAYFQQRVREMERSERKEHRGLTWKDMFRKREMPQFHYEPRFATEEAHHTPSTGEDSTTNGIGEHLAMYKRRNTKIKRRFDIADKDYMKPVPATRILLYTMLVCLLLYWILF